MRNSRWRALIAAAVVTSPVVPLDPAAAQTGGACAKHRLCVWSERDFTGCFAEFDLGPAEPGVFREEPHYKQLRWANCPDRHLNDDVSSYRNHSESYVFFYTDARFRGLKWCTTPGSQEANLNERFPGPADDTFSSHREGPDDSGRRSDPGDDKYCNWADND
jgi:hypothetical protein